MKAGSITFTVWAHCGEDGWCPVSQDFNRRWKADAERREINNKFIFGKPFYRRPVVIRHVVTQSEVDEIATERRYVIENFPDELSKKRNRNT